eukprot:SAG22_NODE_532_length_9401_cov_29.999892_1_plen_46_part_10
MEAPGGGGGGGGGGRARGTQTSQRPQGWRKANRLSRGAPPAAAGGA